MLKNLELGSIKEELNLPSFEEEFKKIPKFEIPDMGILNMEGLGTSTGDNGLNLGEEDLKELEKIINEETQSSGKEATETNQ